MQIDAGTLGLKIGLRKPLHGKGGRRIVLSQGLCRLVFRRLQQQGELIPVKRHKAVFARAVSGGNPVAVGVFRQKIGRIGKGGQLCAKAV